MKEIEDLDLPRRQFGLGWIAAMLALIGVPCTFYFVWIYPLQQHERARKRMDIEVLRLAFNRPTDLTDDQWAYCILWTWNLHSNYGYSYISTSDLDHLTDELQLRIDEGPDVATIDWFWDEYIKAVPRAENYNHFRPTAIANRSDFEAGVHSGERLSRWRSDYERITGRD